MLLKQHSINKPIYVEGAFKIWLRNKSVDYFVLKANAKTQQIENEDSDGNSVFGF